MERSNFSKPKKHFCPTNECYDFAGIQKFKTHRCNKSWQTFYLVKAPY